MSVNQFDFLQIGHCALHHTFLLCKIFGRLKQYLEEVNNNALKQTKISNNLILTSFDFDPLIIWRATDDALFRFTATRSANRFLES
jgi:hypothetical protein